MRVLRKAGSKLFSKEIITKGYGFHTPQDGSVCKLRIIADEKQAITDLDDNSEKEIVVGDVDEPIDRILEDCIRTMKEEEECLLKFIHPCFNDGIFVLEETRDGLTTKVAESDQDESKESENPVSINDNPAESDEQGDDNSQNEEVKKEEIVQTEENNCTSQNESEQDECVTPGKEQPDIMEIRFQLISYTREPEIWEMSVTEKWRRASYHKQKGLELYSRGAYQYAFRRFGLTLKYVISLEHDIPSGQEEGMDIKGLKLSCYLNVAACQMRHHSFESVVINSTKALALQPNNAKALYRRGSAHLQLQEFEKAKEDLSMAQQLEPKNQAIAKQQQLLKTQVQKLNQYYASAMKKLFS